MSIVILMLCAVSGVAIAQPVLKVTRAFGWT